MNVVLDDKVGKATADADGVVIRADDEQPAYPKPMPLNVFHRTDNVGIAALFMVFLKRFVLQEFNAHCHLDKARPFEQFEHFIVKADLVTRLNLSLIHI